MSTQAGPRSVGRLRGELTGSRGRFAPPGDRLGFAPETHDVSVGPPLHRDRVGDRGRLAFDRSWRGTRYPPTDVRNRTSWRTAEAVAIALSCALAPRGHTAVRLSHAVDEDAQRRHPRHPRAQLARRRRQRADPRPARHRDRRRPARQAQARVHAARHRRLRRRRQRGEDLGDRQQARGQEVLPPLRLPRRIRSARSRKTPARRPEEVIRHAVKGMLPRNCFARKQITKLKVYAGPDHRHARSRGSSTSVVRAAWQAVSASAWRPE